ncbi:MAG: hypothetical protein GXX08_12015 [Firmicutes bacterium]|nr:hypothetical protein [Bacillota bacterium]
MDENQRNTDRRRDRPERRGDLSEEYSEAILDEDTRLYRPSRYDYEFARSVSPARNDTDKRKRTTTRTATATRRTETGATTSRTRARSKASSHDIGGGVFVSPLPITAGDRVTLKYNGLLSRSGATRVFAHVGYGRRNWVGVTDMPMTKEPDGTWTAQIQIDRDQMSPLNVCFRDSAHNWDNNYGNNWSFEIH